MFLADGEFLSIINRGFPSFVVFWYGLKNIRPYIRAETVFRCVDLFCLEKLAIFEKLKNNGLRTFAVVVVAVRPVFNNSDVFGLKFVCDIGCYGVFA